MYRHFTWIRRIGFLLALCLLLEQRAQRTPVGRGRINDWQVLLNNTVPIDLSIDADAGSAQLDLRGLDLTALEVEIDAGTTAIDLSSPLDHDLQVTINGGAGAISVKLPDGMGVQATVDTGVGGLTNAGLTKEGDYYVNEEFGAAPYTLFLNITTGLGDIELLAANP